MDTSERLLVRAGTNSVYEHGTRIHIDDKAGGCCGNTTKQPAVDGVLCCKTSAAKDLELQAATGHGGAVGKDLADVRAGLGRKLTPINVTTYGWYYTW